MDTRIDNVYTILFVLAIFSAVYLYYMTYTKETFQAMPVSRSTVAFPAPAAITTTSLPVMVPRDVSPSGPSPPNARVSNEEAKKKDVYQAIPSDPQDESYGSQDIKDNLRYPERMFGPGVVNGGNKILQKADVASKQMLGSAQPIQTFSPEMIQNGGIADDGVAANDTQLNQNYSSF